MTTEKAYSGQVRQGDVLVERASAKDIAGLKETKPVFALGENTGHHHRFNGPQTNGFYKEGDDNVMAGGTALARFAEIVGKPDALVHEEHGPILRAPGVDRKIQQVEYAREFPRNVAD